MFSKIFDFFKKFENFRKFSPRKKYFRLFVVTLRFFLWNLDFLDTKLCRFFPRRRLNRLDPTVLHAQTIKRVLSHRMTQPAESTDSDFHRRRAAHMLVAVCRDML